MKQSDLSDYISTDTDEDTDGEMECPAPGCDYRSSEQGVKIHYGRTLDDAHDGTISGTLIECENCGETTRRDTYRLDRSDHLFCGKSCMYEWREENWTGEDAGGWEGGKIETECATCGADLLRKPFHIENHENHYCDANCRGMGLRTGGYGIYRRLQLMVGPTTHFYAKRKYFGEDLSELDCEMCDETDEGVEIEAHHIVPLMAGGTNGEYNYLLLCREHHERVERYTREEIGIRPFIYDFVDNG